MNTKGLQFEDFDCSQKPVQTVFSVIATNLSESDFVRGPNKPPKNATSHQSSFSQANVKCFNAHESITGEYSRDIATNTNYSLISSSYCAGSAVSQATEMPTGNNLLLNHKNGAGDNCERDNHNADHTTRSVHKSDLLHSIDSGHVTSSITSTKTPILGCNATNHTTILLPSVSTGQTLKSTTSLNTIETPIKSQKPAQKAVENPFTVTTCNDCYKKLSYVVLVGNTVRTCNTKLYASLPLQSKYMVKQRVQNSSGVTKIQLVVKSTYERYI